MYLGENANRIHVRWWEQSDKARAVCALVEQIKEDQSYRVQNNKRHAAMYLNRTLATSISVGSSRAAPLTLNICQSMVDTVYNKITKHKPKPMFLTDDGDWSQQNRAKKLTKAVAGVFYEVAFYEHLSRAFRDATIFDGGLVKWFAMDGKIRCERVFPGEIFVDDYDADNGKPTSWFQTKALPRANVARMFPEHAAIIKGAPAAEFSTGPKTDAPDLVDVIEAWHLADGDEAGLHLIALRGEEDRPLLEEPWKYDRPPFVGLQWCKPIRGWWGQGLVEQLEGLQTYVSSVMQSMLRYSLVSVPSVWIERAAKIVKAHLHAYGELQVNEYSGTPPIQMAPQMAALQWYIEQIRFAISQAYQIAGISQMSAQSIKPAGLNSGKGLRIHHDIETERFASVEKAYEDAMLESAEWVVDLAKELDEELEGGFELCTHDSKSMERIRWADVDMERDSYVMKVFPTNFLPDTPSGKWEEIQEMVQSGMLPKEEAFSLLDYPDLSAVSSYMNAPLERIKLEIEEMLDKGVPHKPDPFTNLQLAMRIAPLAYTRAVIAKAPEDRLELLRQYMTECEFQLAQKQQPQQPQLAAPPIVEPPQQPMAGPLAA